MNRFGSVLCQLVICFILGLFCFVPACMNQRIYWVLLVVAIACYVRLRRIRIGRG